MAAKDAVLEPGSESEQFDWVWEDEKGRHAMQVKSTDGQFSMGEAERNVSLIFDDVWREEHLVPFSFGFSRASIASSYCVLVGLSNDERNLVAY